MLIAFYTDFFYNVIISWALYYFFASFTSRLPWMECGEWSTENCFSGHLDGEKYPECEYKDRRSPCDEYMGCMQSSNCELSQNFSYPVMDRLEAKMSSFKPAINDMFNTSYSLYNNATDSVTLSHEHMQAYCEWKPKSTGPAAEYFQ